MKKTLNNISSPILMALFLYFPAFLIACEDECTPQCENMQCGDDGCGGSCGTCSYDEICNEDGICVSEHLQECSEIAEAFIDCGFVDPDIAYDFIIDCEENFSNYSCYNSCMLYRYSCASLFRCTSECDGVTVEQICNYIVVNVYDTCGFFFYSEAGVELTGQEAFNECINYFNDFYYCTLLCIELSSTCDELLTCINDYC